MERATSNYLKKVSNVAKLGFSSPEEKESCIANVFAELEEGGLLICQCPETSRIVEQFVSLGTAQNLDVLLKVLSKDIVTVLKDKCASHVLETLLIFSTKLIQSHVLDFSIETGDEENEAGEESVKEFDKPEDSLINMIIDLSQLFLDDIEGYLTDQNSSHVLRTLLQILGGKGIEIKNNKSKQVGYSTEQATQKFSDFDVPELFIGKMRTIGKCMFKTIQANDLLLDSHTSFVIQTLLMVSHKVDMESCQKYIKKLIKLARISDEHVGQDAGVEARLPPVMTDKVGSFLIEQIMSLASPEVYSQLYKKLFKGNMLQFAVHPKANFVLKALLSSCSEKSVFKEQFEELKDHFEDILAYGHYGLIIALAEACKKLECKQKPFKQSLMTALHCRDPVARQKKLSLLILTMKTYEVYYKLPVDGDKPENTDTPEKTPDVALCEGDVIYFGSTLIQEMLRFTGTKLIVSSFLDMSSSDLSFLAYNSFGCYALEAFFQSKNVALQSKDSLIDICKNKSIDMACHRLGCQFLQSVWKHLTLEQKSSLAEELCKDEIKVRSDFYGKFVYSNLALQHFKKRPKDWEELQQKEVKKRKLFNDMIGQGISHKRQKKSNENQLWDLNENSETFEAPDNMADTEGRRGSMYRGRGGRGDNYRGQFRGVGDSPRGGFRGRGDNFRDGQRGRGDNHSRGGYRGRGDNHRGGQRGRGDNHRGGYRGRGENSNRGSFRGRGGNLFGNFNNDLSSRGGHHEGDNGDRGKGRGNFRGRGTSRGRGDKRGPGSGGFKFSS